MQIEGSVMSYSKLDGELGKSRVLGSTDTLTVCPMLAGSQTGAHGVETPKNSQVE